MGKYSLPDIRISDSWQGHRNRNSAEPGTDFALAYGSRVVAPYAGTVRVADSSPSGAPGRYVGIDLTDGNYVRLLHLSKVSVKPGQKVTRGQLVGYSGGSGFGQNRHYGAHVHISLWVGTDPIKSSWTATSDIVAYSNAHGPKHVTVNRPLKDIQKKIGATPDGIWGPETEGKVKDYQRANRLTPDGIWGPKTDAKAFPPKPPKTVKGVYADIQRALNRHGYKLAVDNVWGPKSHAALGDFQRKNGLTVDYIVGPKTRAKLGM